MSYKGFEGFEGFLESDAEEETRRPVEGVKRKLILTGKRIKISHGHYSCDITTEVIYKTGMYRSIERQSLADGRGI